MTKFKTLSDLSSKKYTEFKAHRGEAFSIMQSIFFALKEYLGSTDNQIKWMPYNIDRARKPNEIWERYERNMLRFGEDGWYTSVFSIKLPYLPLQFPVKLRLLDKTIKVTAGESKVIELPKNTKDFTPFAEEVFALLETFLNNYYESLGTPERKSLGFSPTQDSPAN